MRSGQLGPVRKGISGLAIWLLAAAGLYAVTTEQSWSDQPAALVLGLKNAASTQTHGSVGMLFSRSCPNGRCGMFATCSLVLVAPDVVLTAAHCVANPDKDYRVFFPGEGLIGVVSGGVDRFCDGHERCDPVAGDVASLRLTRPARGLEPAQRSRTTGSPGLMVGFGDSDPTRADNGILRQASVPIEPCGPQTLCYRFDQDSPAACNHDSGGPMFGPHGLMGLARQTGAGCVTGTGTYTDLTGSWLNGWWQARVGGRSGGTARSRIIMLEDCTAPGCWLGGPGRTLSFPFKLDETAGTVQVTINFALRTDETGCEEAGKRACVVDYDLDLRPPAAADDLACQCDNDFHQVSACRCDVSAPGEWTAVVRSVINRGPFQLMVRQLPAEGGQPPIPQESRQVPRRLSPARPENAAP